MSPAEALAKLRAEVEPLDPTRRPREHTEVSVDLTIIDRLLDVAEAAEFVRHASDCAQVSWAHLVLEGHRGDELPECTCWRHDVEKALLALVEAVQ